MATKTKTPAPDYTVAGLAKAVEAVFHGYGFKALNPTVKQDAGRHGPNGSITISFDKEYASGIAAFSQQEVTVSATIYLGDNLKVVGELKPWDLWQLDTLAVLDDVTKADVLEHGALVRLDVHYTHHDMGSNGKTVRYSFKDGKLSRNANN